ncbi:hypothetical protein MTBBW1_2490003 [Desulfamplus magnetovallimortis]|uniref:Uncharacterized protein n=1 Tax=Desulfamplus magnetovallimortis TaxID=1246637 RepID=A0A1W1HEG7_9BACT|nr:hypothetical protein MTBBW1_2490003 [Desulfamplus magnetovallimortis]
MYRLDLKLVNFYLKFSKFLLDRSGIKNIFNFEPLFFTLETSLNWILCMFC